MMDPLTHSRERAVLDAIDARRGELVELAASLIAYDTTARVAAGSGARGRELQEFLAADSRARGADRPVGARRGRDRRRASGAAGPRFDGRPQLAARFNGTGGGRSLLLNGHIDVVSPEPLDRWTSDPWRAEVRDGQLYGRGSGDMKGGIAAMVTAAETLAELGVPLAGD